MSPPHSQSSSVYQGSGDVLSTNQDADHASPALCDKERPLKLVWHKVAQMGILHTTALYALLFTTWKCKASTLAWSILLFYVSSLGITAGAHRLWSHRAYKARFPLRVFLATCQTMAGQTDILNWVREHRPHHKFSDTDADPHNANRGFFFSHIGWMMVRKHPDVAKFGKKIDYSDLLADPVVTLQKKYYLPLFLVFWLTLPVVVPCFFWGESITNSFLVAVILRYVVQLNVTWLVNSAAHMWGNKPYDHRINPSENVVVSMLAIGEGWHNYHHVFPFDYRTGEFGWRLNPTSMFIDAMAWIGQVTDRRMATPDMIMARLQRTGDKTQ